MSNTLYRFVGANIINNGFTTIGPMTVRVYMRRGVIDGNQGGWDTHAPVVSAKHGGWEQIGDVEEDTDPEGNNCWRVEFRTWHQGWAPQTARGGPEGNDADAIWAPPPTSEASTPLNPVPAAKRFWVRFTMGSDGATPGDHVSRMIIRFNAQAAGSDLYPSVAQGPGSQWNFVTGANWLGN